MTLSLYNTLTREKSEFKPLDPENVRMYVCGPTVYDFAHIGNARPAVVFDLLFRLLRHEYGEKHVYYARNITDIDDKIMTRAREENIPIEALTERTTRYYHEDLEALGVLPPTYEPKATEYVSHMLELIANLIEKGHAYEADNHVLFHVPSMPGYGGLSRRNRDEMIAGARVEPASYKKDPADFTLWKPSTDDQPGWDSPYGCGRPGWHIECSAMSHALFGENFDIHGGGIDLVFPHHENEIAQSTCGRGGNYATIWMHNGFVQIDGKKMSKSLGNFLTVRQILEDKGVSGAVARFTLLRTHYRQPLDWTDAAVKESENILKKRFEEIADLPEDESYPVPDAFIDALKDDLNTPAAIAVMHGLKKEELAGALRFLGIQKRQQPTTAENAPTDAEIHNIIQKRNEARAAKDYATADSLRKHLLTQGVILEDTPGGVTFRREAGL